MNDVYILILNTVITTLIGMFVGFLITKLKFIKNRDDEQNKALMIMLQSNLTNTYFAYESLGQIPDYVYQNWLNELERYEALGGNSYIHTLAKRMENFKIIHTDILK